MLGRVPLAAGILADHLQMKDDRLSNHRWIWDTAETLRLFRLTKLFEQLAELLVSTVPHSPTRGKVDATAARERHLVAALSHPPQRAP